MTRSSCSSRSSNSLLSQSDKTFLRLAAQRAVKGKGHTFPNPAVGCVLVARHQQQEQHEAGEPIQRKNDTTTTIVGQGFHPRAGFPHAEVFALLEAAGYVESGVEAAQAVVTSRRLGQPTQDAVDDKANNLATRVEELLKVYASQQGPEQLFADSFSKNKHITAYVTLEPCCHYGQTPPCALALVAAQVQRVVVGVRDPNPRVDGGGVALLEQHGIHVDILDNIDDTSLLHECNALLTNFVKRITPHPRLHDNGYGYVTGAMRMALRSRTNKLKREKRMPEVVWGGGKLDLSTAESLQEAVGSLALPAEWMEHLDDVLWQHELVVVRLGNAVGIKKATKLLGARIAKALNAHIAQTLGHTVLLYRPGVPPILDLEEMVVQYKRKQETKEGNQNS